MNEQLACLILRHSSPFDWFVFPIALIFGSVSLLYRYWTFIAQWFGGIQGRDWPLMPATVDVVTVAVQTEQTRYGERTIGYLATLTYFYRNPDLQMGEFSRMFNEEQEAQTWTGSYKGRTVTVHLDPRDVSRSVLRKEEL